MKKGDLPHILGGYTLKAIWDDGAVASQKVMLRLLKTGKINRPAHTSVHSNFTLVIEDGIYNVKLRDGSTQRAYFIGRKEIWVTPDGATAVEGVVSWEKE